MGESVEVALSDLTNVLRLAWTTDDRTVAEQASLEDLERLVEATEQDPWFGFEENDEDV